MTQVKLLESIRAKESQSLAILYETYAKSFFAVISNQVRDRDDAREVLVQVFFKIWNDIDSFDESRERLYTWMLGIARAEAANRGTQTGPGTSGLSTNFVTLADTQDNRIGSIGIAEFAKKLKPKCIQLFELLLFRGMMPDRASDQLQITPEDLRIQNRNCMNDLRNYLQL